ncbi:MAG: hypothetical protein LPK85_05520 [Gammaproteobacteria bacterium]|nr:hypothetical protein [Gammaproteobacteria bacterium]
MKRTHRSASAVMMMTLGSLTAAAPPDARPPAETDGATEIVRPNCIKEKVGIVRPNCVKEKPQIVRPNCLKTRTGIVRPNCLKEKAPSGSTPGR